MSDFAFTRRTVLGALGAALILPQSALAFSSAQAEALIDKAVADINAIINSGKSESAMYVDFEKVLVRYADMPNIARSVLGPPARSASAAQLRSFTKAFQTYVARKYGSRFREFIGGRVEVNSTQKINSIYDVRCTAVLKGEPPFAISFIVHDKAGKFIDLQIEGISLLKSERSEIGAMLDKAGGNIDKLAAALS
ncbi:MlaC/ttg2D family ABC transporter substrate-binding protein [Celeribacter halophilus]|jgi:phospholipid transport system substrate-binding protein|uniref:ABC transporter substrate-binding protein n=1 Tax=Celeribacter halophilus TaxID=576117 RepID=A0AAW7XY45_9RHOB|nr:ABC transporter substrate-binding protein [Celeribacter halophilus]MBU2890005.1 ABC transporter substrate-binding protein [Celeribacter halophilus]MDO6457779.1 ABC transporter substrate-binding protein [Celeribacter halophilus]MDO6511382.1 ABC transporter substrate-binding protein [Celeribacter halophilus]MDO6724037.1 ABC transporter substrate-binding protein [Celeribacter halophilus]